VRVDGSIASRSLWLSEAGEAEIVISCRVRLARNLAEQKFPGWADETDRRTVCRELCSALTHVECLTNPRVIDMSAVGEVDKAVLLERRLISHELSQKGAGSALVLAEEQGIAAMINEEDHLRLQAIVPGMDLGTVWDRASRVDTALESRVRYAFSHRIGYLTACPSNVGTGLRASVMMHLSGLKLTNDLDGTLNGVEKLGFAVRGVMGEGTDAHGDLFQLSNMGTLGRTETDTIGSLAELVGEVVTHERNARARLMEDRRCDVLDYVGRALGVLTHARILSSHEAIDLLSALRLGIELGMVRHLTVARVNEMLLLTQPGHLQKMAGQDLDSATRDQVRADLMRRRLRQASLAG
jgi:protein arginine kinase